MNTHRRASDRNAMPRHAASDLIDLANTVARLVKRVEELERLDAGSGSELPVLLDANDLAKHLGVSRRTVQTLLAKGEIAPIRVGRQLRFSRQSVEAYLRRSVGRNRRK